MKEEYKFDFDEILDEFRSGKKLTGKGGLLAPLSNNSQKLHSKQK